MKKILAFVLFTMFMMIVLAGCAPGSTIEVTTPETTIRLSAPGPNPLMNQPDASGRIARAGAGLWHGIIAPVTLVLSFFNSNMHIYEVHNVGSEYDLGFFLGFTLVIAMIGILLRMRGR